MTRINAGIPPSRLTTRHLIAEHREIKRIPNSISNGKAIVKKIPENFTLGTGHVKFFYDKLGFLLNRYWKIHEECLRRGFNVTNYSGAWDSVPKELMNNWTPKISDIKLIVNRINERGGFNANK